MWNPEITYEINGEDGVRITCTTLGAINRMAEQVRRDFNEDTSDEEILLPFEFIIGSLFPASYGAIKDTLTYQYIEGHNKGYTEGYQDGAKEWKLED